MAKPEWQELNVGDTTLRFKLTDTLKKNIEEAYNAGFDPESVKEPQSGPGLVLPESCLPKFEEICVVNSESKSDFEIAQEIQQIIDSALQGERLAFDFVEEREIMILERVLSENKGLMEQKRLTFRLTQRMMKRVQDLQVDRWKKRNLI